MPIYEYQCQACGSRIEAMQKVGDPPPGDCEECGGELKKLISAPAFQFKGSGWYVTDYAKKGGEAKGEKADAKGDGSKDAGAKDDVKVETASKSSGSKGSEKASGSSSAASD